MKRSTVLIAILAIVAASAVATVWAEDHTFVGAAKCKMCHKAQHTSWMETSHAKALDSAKAATDRTFGPDCLKCHATNADEKLAGVQCEGCHGTGSDYKKMSVMKDREKAVLFTVQDATVAGKNYYAW